MVICTMISGLMINLWIFICLVRGNDFTTWMNDSKSAQITYNVLHTIYPLPLEFVLLFQIYEWITMLYIIRIQKGKDIGEIMHELESDKLGDSYVGVEHLMLSILRIKELGCTQVLTNRNITYKTFKEK